MRWRKQTVAQTDTKSGENSRMKNMKSLADIIKNITMLTQFGLSFITPLLLCLALCWWLCTHVGLGGWVYIPGFFFGLGGSFTVAYKLYLSVTNQQKKQKEKTKKTVSFNRHS
jgi:positive regulator of sigma E activity